MGFELLGLEAELELLNALEEAIVIMSLIELFNKNGWTFWEGSPVKVRRLFA
jgi:hypothetical protein